MRNPPIFKDNLFTLCISLAKISKGNDERYGSILMKDGKIIGMGYNRAIAHPYIHLERIIRMGYANHAEIEAMDDALQDEFDIRGADIYCAGYFPKPHTGFLGSDRLILKDGAWYTCVRCPPYMENYGIANVYVPTPSGWAGMSVEEADNCGQCFTQGTHEKRIGAVSTSFTLADISGSLVSPEYLHMD